MISLPLLSSLPLDFSLYSHTVSFEGQEGNQDGIQALRNKIMQVFKQEPYMGEKIPVRYVNVMCIFKIIFT